MKLPNRYFYLICVGAITCLIIETGRVQNISPSHCNSTDICTCFQDVIPEIFIPRCVQRRVTGLNYLDRALVGSEMPVMWKENLTNDGWKPWCHSCTPTSIQHLSMDILLVQVQPTFNCPFLSNPDNIKSCFRDRFCPTLPSSASLPLCLSQAGQNNMVKNKTNFTAI